MASKLRYLNKSPQGNYEYRRRVPTELQSYFPRTQSGRPLREWKQALGTDNEGIARKRWYIENEKFEDALRVARILTEAPEAMPVADHLARAKKLINQFGLHPDKAPHLGPSATDEDYLAFKKAAEVWNDKLSRVTAQILDVIDDVTIDTKQEEIDYQNGTWGRPDYTTPRTNIPSDQKHLDLALSVMSGETTEPAKPTWRDAIELYISTNKRENSREAEKARRWEVKTRNLLKKFGDATGGMTTPLDKLERALIINWLWREYPSAPTRNRYNNTFSAVINCWNRENKEQIYNPFSGLSNKKQELEEAIERRSFKPDEWFAYLDGVKAIGNIEMRLIGLLMIFTGCRTSEAAGIQVRDLKLTDNMPHVVFRTNRLRRMDKQGLERAVPLMTPLLEAFRDYKMPSDPNQAVFGRYGTTKGFDSVSVTLRDLIQSTLGIKEKALVPYSTRHTLIDRATAASVPLPRAEYIVGHKSEGSSAIHRRYGTMTPPNVIFDDMAKIFQATEWGYYEE